MYAFSQLLRCQLLSLGLVVAQEGEREECEKIWRTAILEKRDYTNMYFRGEGFFFFFCACVPVDGTLMIIRVGGARVTSTKGLHGNGGDVFDFFFLVSMFLFFVSLRSLWHCCARRGGREPDETKTYIKIMRGQGRIFLFFCVPRINRCRVKMRRGHVTVRDDTVRAVVY